MVRLAKILVGVVGAAVASVAFAAVADAAVTPPSATVDCGAPFADLTFVGSVGESFTITNSSGADSCAIAGISGVVSGSGPGFLDLGGAKVYLVSGNQPATFTIIGPGTFTLSSPGSGMVTVTVSTSGQRQTLQTPPSYQFTYWLPGSPAVECGSLRQTVVSGTQVSLPGADANCQVAGVKLVGWQIPGSSEPLTLGAQVVVSGDQQFTAVFSTTNISVTQNANVGSDVACLVNGQSAPARFETTSLPRAALTLARSAPCAPVGLSLKGWNTKGDGKGTTYAPGATVPAADVESLPAFAVYAVWGAPALTMEPATASVSVGEGSTVKISDPGMARQQVSVSAAGAISLPSGSPTTVTLGADGAASVSYGATSTAGTGTVSASAGGVNATATITVTETETKSITITIVGSRTTVSGYPGITVDGITTGFAANSTVVPYFRFPGETSYSQGSARPVVGATGSFIWQRKTGKKFYAYVTSEDGKVQSNRVIIPAN